MVNSSKNKDIFELLVINAIDFFDQSIEEFKKKPKYSVIHFASGIELFIKARLAYEHWTLIAASIDDKECRFNDAVSGKMKTVTVEKAKERLKRLELIDKNGKYIAMMFQAFDQLASFRNKIIHFSSAIKEEKNTIVSLQCQVWYYLYDLLDTSWKDIFESCWEDIQALNNRMRTYSIFLDEKFNILKTEIETERNAGTLYQKCVVCHHDSYKDYSFQLGDIEAEGGICKVCNFDDHVELTGTCPRCHKETILCGKQEVLCKHCDYTFSPEQLLSVLDENYHSYRHIKDVLNEQIYHCYYCEEIYTVAYLDNIQFLDPILFCTNCLKILEKTEAEEYEEEKYIDEHLSDIFHDDRI